jgi:hypothetical protein
MMLRTITFLALTSAAFGQLTGPVMGYLPDGSSLRAINGIPASGTVGAAVTPSRNLAVMQVAPGQPMALATAADTGEVLLLTPSTEGATILMTSVAGATAGASKIVFSPNGSAAALWISGTSHLQILTNLTATPTVRDIDASFLTADPAALAVSDDGQWAAGAWAAGLYTFAPDSSVRTLPVDSGVQQLAFFHSKNDLAVFSPTQVVTFADIAGAATPTVLWSQSADAAAASKPVAVGLGVTADNAFLTIAADSGALFTINLATGAGTPADCGCKPLGVTGLSGTVFRLNGVDAGPLKIFDAATNDVWFVPLASTAVAGGQQ